MSSTYQRYVCPHCKKNETVSELSLAWVESEGRLDQYGDVELFKGIKSQIMDSPDDPLTYYRCNSCFKEFKEPLDLEK